MHEVPLYADDLLLWIWNPVINRHLSTCFPQLAKYQSTNFLIVLQMATGVHKNVPFSLAETPLELPFCVNKWTSFLSYLKLIPFFPF